MLNQIPFTYETTGSSSYLVAAFKQETDLIPYQVEMLISNEISHFLPVSRRMMNGEAFLYYNLSSRVSLNQILERRKLKQSELLKILDGIVQAAEDSAEYQLPLSGLLMDPEYIYVDPSDCSPFFVFLPMENQEAVGSAIRRFISDLILQGKLELTEGNFVQILLEAVNREPFSIHELETCVKKTKESGRPDGKTDLPRTTRSDALYGAIPDGAIPAVSQPMGAAAVPETISGMAAVSAAISGATDVPGAIFGAGVPSGAGAGQAAGTARGIGVGTLPGAGMTFDASMSSGTKGVPDGVSQPDLGKGKGRRARTKAKAVPETSPEKKDDGPDKERAKRKFLLPQAPIMIILAALASFGAFVNQETGNIEIKNILAAVLLTGVLEIILYREAFVNGKKENSGARTEKKEKKKKEKKEKAPGKKDSTRKAPLPGGVRPPVPTMQESENLKEKPGARKAGKQEIPQIPIVNAGQPGMPQMRFGDSEKPEIRQRIPGTARGQEIPQAPLNLAGRAEMSPPHFLGGNSEVLQRPVSLQMPDFDAVQEGETELFDGSDASQEAWLEYYENGLLTRIPLERASTLIGRLKGQVDFAVANPRVGKIHAEFLLQDGMICVRDLNSKNGTYINGNSQRIGSNVPFSLKDGDRIALADSVFTLRCGIR